MSAKIAKFLFISAFLSLIGFNCIGIYYAILEHNQDNLMIGMVDGCFISMIIGMFALMVEQWGWGK